MSGEFAINYFFVLYWPLGTDQVFLTSGRCMALGPKKMDDCRATFNGTNGTWFVLVFPLIWVLHQCNGNGKWQVITTGRTVMNRCRVWWWHVGPPIRIFIVINEDWGVSCRTLSNNLMLMTVACWSRFKSIPSPNIKARTWATVRNGSHMAGKVKT